MDILDDLIPNKKLIVRMFVDLVWQVTSMSCHMKGFLSRRPLPVFIKSHSWTSKPNLEVKSFQFSLPLN